MILDYGDHRRNRKGFTRMSGDDPELASKWNDLDEFYPHERG